MRRKKSNLVYFTVEDRNIVKNLKEKVVETTFGVLTDMTTETFNNLSEADKAKYKEIEVDNKKAYIEIFEPEIYKLDGTKAVVNYGYDDCSGTR